MPYKPDKSITCQIGDSLTKSLKHLRHVDSPRAAAAQQQPYIDCLLLHSPFPDMKETKEAWRAMELHVPSFVRTLGVSNVYDLELLRQIFEFASTKPAVLQNRFYAGSGYDADIRAFCAEKGITYQAFWTLTANPELLGSEVVKGVAGKVGVSEAVALYALVLGLGQRMSVLDGTTREERMREDLERVEKVGAWAEREGEAWEEARKGFGELIAG